MEKTDYIISNGLVSLLENRFKTNLNDRSKEEIKDIELEFANQFRSIVDKENKFNYTILEEDEIIDMTSEMLSKSKNPLVSYDDVYGFNGDFSISSTRLTNPKTLESKIGERHGALPIDIQRANLKEKFAGKTIDIYDIGIFEGDTLFDEVENVLPNLGINVGKIYVTIGNTEAIEKLEKIVDIEIAREFSFGEWLESRDPLLYDGRKVAKEGQFSNVSNNDLLIIPYTCNPAWSSISVDNFIDYTKLCNQYSKKIDDALTRSGYQVTRDNFNQDSNGIFVQKLTIK